MSRHGVSHQGQRPPFVSCELDIGVALHAGRHPSLTTDTSQRAGWTPSGVAIVHSRSAACRLYVSQAQDVLRDLHMPALEVLHTARMALHDHILIDGPHDRPTALLDHGPTQDLFAAVLGATGPLFASHVDGLRSAGERTA